MPSQLASEGGRRGFIIADSGAAVLIVHADLLPSLRGALSGQLRVVVVEPEASVRAAFALLDSAYGTPEGATDWRRWSADARPASIQAPCPTSANVLFLGNNRSSSRHPPRTAHG